MREIKWIIVYRELATYQVKYEIIIHEMSIDQIDSNEAQEATIKLLKMKNINKEINIIKLISFKWKTRIITKMMNQFIIIFIDKSKAANKCIREDIYLNHRMYIAEKYAS